MSLLGQLRALVRSRTGDEAEALPPITATPNIARSRSHQVVARNSSDGHFRTVAEALAVASGRFTAPPEADETADGESSEAPQAVSDSTSSPSPIAHRDCSSCGDSVAIYADDLTGAQYQEYYHCGSPDHAHLLCALCFGEWIKHCAGDYAYDKLPARCPCAGEEAPGCEKIIRDSEIQRLLAYELNLHVAPVYERACILSGLLDASKENTPVTCAVCNEFTALFPKNFRDRAARLKLLMLKEADAEENLQLNSLVDGSLLLGSLALELHSDLPLASPALPNRPASLSSGLNKPMLERQQSTGVLTSLFFDCEDRRCGGVTCLRCLKAVPAADKDIHICDESRVDVFYEELLGILAQGSTRKCPKCNKAGQKDEHCTHITCPECECRWCYVCSKDAEDFSDYYDHSTWTFTDEDEKKCPQYLQWKYYSESTTVDDSGRFPYSGAEAGKIAQERFHISLQQKLVEEWKAQYSGRPQDAALIEEMIEMKFPYGLFDSKHLEAMEEAEMIRQIWKLESSPLERKCLLECLRELISRCGLHDLILERKLENRLEFIEKSKTLFKNVIDARMAEDRAKAAARAEEQQRAREQRARELEERRRYLEEHREEIRQERIRLRQFRENRREIIREARQERIDRRAERERRLEEEKREEENRIERERIERERISTIIAETAKRQDEEFRRLRALALKRKPAIAGAPITGSSTAADRRKQRREIQRLELQALRNTQEERVKQLKDDDEKKQ